MSEYSKTIAVDFDGCLCKNKWPGIGEPNWMAIMELKKRKAMGDNIILWTCRNGQALDEAVQWCREKGIEFDAVNKNLQSHIDHFGEDTRKIFANEYWDDRAVKITAQQERSAITVSASRNASWLESIVDKWDKLIGAIRGKTDHEG